MAATGKVIYSWKYEGKTNIYNQSIRDILENIFQECELKLEQCVAQNLITSAIFLIPKYDSKTSEKYDKEEFIALKASTVYSPVHEWYFLNVHNQIKLNYEIFYLNERDVSIKALYIHREYCTYNLDYLENINY